MWQFVPCNDCGNQIPIPEILEGQPAVRFLRCEACGREVFWDIGLTKNNGALILFSIEDTFTDEIAGDHEIATEGIGPPLLELECESESELESKSEGNLVVETTDSTADSTADFIGDEGSSQFIAPQAESASTPDWSVLGPTTPRQRPREVSAIRKIIPPILGGLAAFPIATLIMWYVVGKDIGSTGPTVAEYVPWIVPQKLRTTPPEYYRNSESSSPTGGRRPMSRPRTSLPKLNREDSKEEPAETSVVQPTLAPKD